MTRKRPSERDLRNEIDDLRENHAEVELWPGDETREEAIEGLKRHGVPQELWHSWERAYFWIVGNAQGTADLPPQDYGPEYDTPGDEPESESDPGEEADSE